MPELRLADLVEATGGHLVRGNPETIVGSYVIDTRRLDSGGCFFALSTGRKDGHLFLNEAAKFGAAAAVVERAPADDESAPEGIVLVHDTLEALTNCGEWIRGHYEDVRWLALTGSNGKTTTKELLAAALSNEQNVHRTPGNFNNHLGVPLTLLSMPADTDTAVLELAMSGPGEIAHLMQMTRPDVGMVTNVRAAHLNSFQSLDDIAAAKGELYSCLDDSSIAIVNLDDVHCRVQATRHLGPRITFGAHPDADVRIGDVQNQLTPGVAFSVHRGDWSRNVQLRLVGAHGAFDAVAALVAALAVGEDLDDACERMERVEAGPGRGQLHRLRAEMLLVDDSYNSSPSALASMLDLIRVNEVPGKKILVMGDMLELGPMEDAMHREAGKRIAAADIDVLVAVGPLSRHSAETARRFGVEQIHHFNDSRKAAAAIPEMLGSGDLVVVKGSRGLRMETIVRTIQEQFEGSGA